MRKETWGWGVPQEGKWGLLASSSHLGKASTAKASSALGPEKYLPAVYGQHSNETCNFFALNDPYKLLES